MAAEPPALRGAPCPRCAAPLPMLPAAGACGGIGAPRQNDGLTDRPSDRAAPRLALPAALPPLVARALTRSSFRFLPLLPSRTLSSHTLTGTQGESC